MSEYEKPKKLCHNGDRAVLLGTTEMKKRRPYTAVTVDPYYQSVPWELIYDDKSRLIGEVYTLPRKRSPKKTPGMQTSLETRHDANQWHLGVARRKMLIEQILQKGIPGLKRRDMEQMSIDKLTELLQQGPTRRRKRCNLCPDDDSTCYCYIDKPTK